MSATASNRPRRGTRRAPRGQHFLTDPNLLDLIIREAALEPDDVVLEIGGGEGALTRLLASRAAHLHVIEIDQRLGPKLEAAAEPGNVSLHWADALRADLAGLDPVPTRMVSNLPYSVATPLILKTIEEVASIAEWTLMVQREIADRLRAAPSGRVYGAPSVLVQLSCEVELIRAVDAAVFKPRPRVRSALIRLRRRGPAAPEAVRTLVHGAFAHRRKALARSVELAGVLDRNRARDALTALGLRLDSRAEALAPEDFARLARMLADLRAPGEALR